MTLEYEINEAAQERAEKIEDVRFETARNLIRGDFPIDSIIRPIFNFKAFK